MDGSEEVNPSDINLNVSSFCTRDDQETSLVCLTHQEAPSCCFPDYPTYFTIIVATYWLLLSVIGGFGNLMVLVAIPYARWRTSDHLSPLKTPTTLLLLNLSLADCLFCFISFPGWSVSLLYREWVLGTRYCYIFGFLIHYLGLASPASLSAATLSRMLALWWPAVHEVLFESCHGIPAVVAIWMLAGVVPTVVGYGYGYSRTKGYCSMIDANYSGDNILYGIASYLPWFIIVISLLLIWIKLRQNWSELKLFRNMGASTLQELKEREKRMTILLTLLGAVYSSLAAPVVVIYTFFKGGPWNKPFVYFDFLLLGYFATNVFLYVYRIPSYRDAFMLLYKDTLGFLHEKIHKRERH